MKTIAVQLLSPYAIAPKFFIVNLKDEDWKAWLFGSKDERIRMLYPYIADRSCTIGQIREVTWIRIDDLAEVDKERLLNYLE